MRNLLLIGFFLVGCSGGPDLVSRAVELKDQTCACADTDCAREKIREINKLSLSEARKKLSGEDEAKFKAATLAAGVCQQTLKNKK